MDGKENYCFYFNRILRDCDDFQSTYLTIREFNKNANKFYALVPYSKALLIARDPIANLKTFIQLNIPKEGWDARKLNPITIALDSNLNEVCENLVRYWNITSEKGLEIGQFPDFRTMSYFVDTELYVGGFHDTQLKNILINLKDSIVIDMSEIIGEKTFDTMIRLSKESGFKAPREDKRREFETARVMEYLNFLPITLEVNVGRIIKIYIKDKALKTGNMHITQILFGQDCFYDRIIVCASEEDWDILRQNSKTLREVKDYLLRFIPRLQQQKEIENKKKITESQVLEYLKKHKDLRIQVKKAFDKHLEFIKSHRPDIVQSWKYYQEFEKMCEEMDKEL